MCYVGLPRGQSMVSTTSYPYVVVSNFCLFSPTFYHFKGTQASCLLLLHHASCCLPMHTAAFRCITAAFHCTMIHLVAPCRPYASRCILLPPIEFCCLPLYNDASRCSLLPPAHLAASCCPLCIPWHPAASRCILPTPVAFWCILLYYDSSRSTLPPLSISLHSTASRCIKLLPAVP